ncbi:MAG: hypothetical protein HY216_01290 [Candidatus Rokubacteria bacterium]|nr:hypothetical protein [Candidatus Rokubacteria bacterium]
MFSGGDYDDVARWLRNFLASHAKRADPRVEVVLDADEREGVSYAARLRFGGRLTDPMEFSFAEVRDRRGELAWCQALADRTRTLARDLVASAAAAASPVR